MIKQIRLFSYYGSKIRMAPKYPPPIWHTIIEPFAGAAGYSCLYHDRKVILYEIDPFVFGVLDYLVRSRPEDILALPLVPPGMDVNDLAISQEARWLIGFWLNNATVSPSRHLSKWGRSLWPDPPVYFWGPKCRERLSRAVLAIKHWTIFNRSWQECPNQQATWFVDPPYANKGIYYKHRIVDYRLLAEWCRDRAGQVLVCENVGADWLPFEPLYDLCGVAKGRKRSVEALWKGAA